MHEELPGDVTVPCVPRTLPDWPDRRVSTSRLVARGLRGLLETIVPAIIIALLINLFVAQATRVYGLSMEPNLHTEQRLVVEKISYNSWLHLRSPQRGDVVVLRINGADELLIKRVIGLPGDQVEIRNGQVFINRAPLDEPYVVLPASGDYSRVDVPPLHIFVLGDNRDFSNDSRTFGPVPMKDVIGRAWFSYWPPETWGPVR
jgi:signal peptidase I